MGHVKIAAFLLAFALGGCAGSRHFHAIDESSASNGRAPRFIELRSAVRVATLHFPRGLYALEAADDAGFYYRAPRKIVEHSYSGALGHEGGLYLSGKLLGKLRGYVYWHGALTHVGNLSHADYSLRD